MPEPSHLHNDEAIPHPKRFYWLKRLGVASLLLVFLLVSLRLIWGHRVQSRIDQAIADIQAKGEPILFEDLQIEPLIDEENGAFYLNQALNNWPFVPGTLAQRITDTDWYIEGEDAGYTDPITDHAAYLQACQPMFDLIEQADQCDRAVWGPPPTRPIYDHLLPHLGDTRELARLVTDAGTRAQQLGNTEQVFDTMLRLHCIAKHVQHNPDGMLDSLVAISIMAMNRDFIEHTLPKLDPSDLREGPARDKAKQVIQRLTDNMLFDGLIKGFIADRVMLYDTYACLLDGTITLRDFDGYDNPIDVMIDTPGLSYMARPLVKNQQHLAIQSITDMLLALETGKTLSEIQHIEIQYENRIIESPLLYPMQGIFFGYNATAYRTQLRCEATLRCAALAIAIRLYQADHDGKRPDTLDQLVPEYIPAIPVDPFNPTGESIKYNAKGIVPKVRDADVLTDEQRAKLHTAPLPTLYSVGEDGIDHQGGELYLHPEGNLDDSDRFPSFGDGELGDIWFLLDAWPEAVFDESDLYGDEFDEGYDDDFPF